MIDIDIDIDVDNDIIKIADIYDRFQEHIK